MFIGRTDAAAEAPILWPRDALEKTLMLGRSKAGGEGGAKDKMVGQHH